MATAAKKTIKRTATTKGAYIARPSQITRKKPTKRLVARRTARVTTGAKVKGYFPNPVKKAKSKFPFEVHYRSSDVTASWKAQAAFVSSTAAKNFAEALAQTYPAMSFRVFKSE